jgi:DNA-directed RNA polymerase subunit RPC12/RpoP
LRPEQNLKTSCYFCKGHVEFPAHALGRKIACPHCKREITLKVQGPESQVLSPESRVQSSESKVQRHEPNVLSPESKIQSCDEIL